MKKIQAAALAATTALLTLQGAATAGTYDALCGGVGCTVSVTADGVGVSGQTIPAHRVTSWHMGGSSETDVATGVATTFLFGGLGLLGFTAKKHDYNFSVSGYDENGKKTSFSFRFINDKPAKQLAARLPGVTGLAVNQTRTIEEIVAYEKGERPAAVLGRVATAGIGAIGGPSLPASMVATKPSNCWSNYLDNNPAMKIWADANPGPAAQNKKRFDDC